MLRMSLHKCMTRRLSHASLVNRLSRHSPCMSLRGNIVTVAISCLLLVLVACGDDDSDFATRPSGGSSSSVTQQSSSCTKSSSSSEYTRVPCNVETDENCFKDDRDGQTYKTVKIGDQVWMAENLNFEMDSSFCYNDSVEYCTKYGRFYSWWTAIEVCPNGWHLPTKMEWDTLFNAVGGQSTADKVLKSTSGWNSNGNGTDAFGFSALSAGYRYYYGYYNYEGDYAYFWSSTELRSGSDYAYFMSLLYDNDGAYLVTNRKVDGFSVRCVKD